MVMVSSKTYISIKPLANLILTGKLLIIDPSTGSQSSLPGYAIYEKGHLLESGVIEVDLADSRSQKLYEISRTVREDFEEPDILVIEYIPPVTYKGGMNSNAVMALQKAIGAILAARPFKNVIEIPAIVWKSYKHPEYIKTDEHDAIAIGRCAIGVAREVITNLTEEAKPAKRAKK